MSVSKFLPPLSFPTVITREIPYTKSEMDFVDLLASPSTSKRIRPIVPSQPKKKKVQKSQKVVRVMAKIVSNDPRKPFICQVCGVTFARSKALDAHVRLHDGKNTIVKCEKCGECGNLAAMRKHEQHHLLEEQALLDEEFDDGKNNFCPF